MGDDSADLLLTDPPYGVAYTGKTEKALTIARTVPGIDAMVVGHTHRDASSQLVRNELTGQDVLLTQPYRWGATVSQVDIDLRKVRGQWDVVGTSATRMPRSEDLTSISLANSMPVVRRSIRTAAAREKPRRPQWKSPQPVLKRNRPTAERTGLPR